MHLSKYLTATALILVAAINADGQASLVTELSLTEIANLAVDCNPELSSLRLQSDADAMTLKTENNLENPEVSFEGLFGEFGENKYNFGISQAFDWPSAYSARKSYAGAASALARANLMVARAEKRLQAVSTLLAIVDVNKRVEILNRSAGHYRQMLETYNRQYARGEVSILDVNKLRIEVADLETELDDALLEAGQLRSTLSTLCGGNPEVMAAAEKLSDFPLAVLQELETYIVAIPASPRVKASEAQASLSHTGIKVVEKENMPGFTLGYRFSREEEQNFNGFDVAMTIPAWGNRGKVAAARADADAKDFATTTLCKQIEQSVRSDYESAARLRDRINTYDKALTISDNLGLLDRAFSAGQIDLNTYITDTRYFLEAESRLSTLRLRYHQLLASLSNLLQE